MLKLTKALYQFGLASLANAPRTFNLTRLDKMQITSQIAFPAAQSSESPSDDIKYRVAHYESAFPCASRPRQFG
jgi:hypothetical protein